MAEKEGIAKRVRKRREELGFTQEDVARAIGVLGQAVWRWENPKKKTVPQGANLTALAKVLQVTERWIMEGEEESRVEDAFAYEEELRSWLATQEGKTVKPDELAELRRYRGKVRPTPLTWHFLLQAARAGVPAQIAQAEEEETSKALSEALARGGKPLERRKR